MPCAIAEGHRALTGVAAENATAYDAAMVKVCAAVLGVSEENVLSVETDFGADLTSMSVANSALQSSRCVLCATPPPCVYCATCTASIVPAMGFVVSIFVVASRRCAAAWKFGARGREVWCIPVVQHYFEGFADEYRSDKMWRKVS